MGMREYNKKVYNDFVNKRNLVFPNFDGNQLSGAQKIIQQVNWLNSITYTSNIDSIISLGSGSGEIEMFLLLQYHNLTCLTLIEQSEKSIDFFLEKNFPNIETEKWSRNTIRNETEYIYKYSEEGFISINFLKENRVVKIILIKEFKELRKQDYSWYKTLMICCGHTIPHFDNWKEIFDKKEICKYWLIDFYETYDQVVEGLVDVGDQKFEIRGVCPYAENLECESFCTYGLATERRENDRIYRGILFKSKIVMSNDCALNPHKENKEFFLIATEQLLQSSQIYFDYLNSEGYIVLKKFDYITGYGHMKGTLLLQKDIETDLVNDCYEKSVKEVLLPEAIKFINDQINISVYFIGILKAFDSLLTFGKYLNIESLLKAKEMEKDSVKILDSDIIVLPMKLPQNSYPAGDKLFSSILSHSGSGVFIPPFLEKRGIKNNNKLDNEYWEAEKKIIDAYVDVIQLDEKRETLNTNNSARKRYIESNYFINIPIFWGSLPVFYIFVRIKKGSIFESDFDKEILGLCERLHGKIIKLLEEKAEVFVYEFIKNLFMESGIINFRDIEVLKNTVNKARMKPWKNWLSTFPEIELNLYQSTKDKNNELDKIILMQLGLLKKNYRVILSKVLQDEKFFEDDNHEMFNEDYHKNIISEIALPFIEKMNKNSYLIKYTTLLFDNMLNDDNADMAFSKLKALFCRSNNNSGKFRFSIMELHCLLEAFTLTKEKGDGSISICDGKEYPDPVTDIVEKQMVIESIFNYETFWNDKLTKLNYLKDICKDYTLIIVTDSYKSQSEISYCFKYLWEFNFSKNNLYDTQRGMDTNSFLNLFKINTENRFIDKISFKWSIEYISTGEQFAIKEFHKDGIEVENILCGESE